MTDEVQQEEIQPQELAQLNIVLNVDQVNVVVNALGKLPTELGVWPLRQFIIAQAQQQLQPAENETE